MPNTHWFNLTLAKFAQVHRSPMLSVFIPFLVVSIIVFILVKPKEIPQRWACFTVYTSWGCRDFTRMLLIMVCLWYIGFYFVATAIFQYDLHIGDAGDIANDESTFYMHSLLYGAVLTIPIGLFFSAIFYSMLATTLLFMIFIQSVWWCANGDAYCYWFRLGLGLLFIFILSFVFKQISDSLRGIMTLLTEHLIVCFAFLSSLMCIAWGFEYWQTDQVTMWIPFAAATILAIFRGLYSFCRQNVTCCHEYEYLEGMLDFFEETRTI